MEKAKKNEIVDIDSTGVLKVDNSNIKIVIKGNTEKIPLSVWLQNYFPSKDSIKELSDLKLSDLKDLLKDLNIVGSICIGTECFHAGACSTNLCNTKENLLALNSAMRICDFKQTLLFITLLLALWW